MKLTNPEKRAIMDGMQEIVLSACTLQQNMDMAQCMSKISEGMLGIRLGEDEMSRILEAFRKHNEECVARFIKLLEIDLENDPYWAKTKERAEEMTRRVKDVAATNVEPPPEG